jgi:DNA-binding NtrC family response regulator
MERVEMNVAFLNNRMVRFWTIPRCRPALSARDAEWHLSCLQVEVLVMHRSQKTILIVEDDEEIRDFLTILIDSVDTIVQSAGTIAEARSVIGNHHVDVMFLDLSLPDGNGMGLLDYWEEFADSKDHPCTIIMSAFADWDNYFSAFNHGAFYFLEKPFKITKMRSILADALKQAEFHSF